MVNARGGAATVTLSGIVVTTAMRWSALAVRSNQRRQRDRFVALAATACKRQKTVDEFGHVSHRAFDASEPCAISRVHDRIGTHDLDRTADDRQRRS